MIDHKNVAVTEPCVDLCVTALFLLPSVLLFLNEAKQEHVLLKGQFLIVFYVIKVLPSMNPCRFIHVHRSENK